MSAPSSEDLFADEPSGDTDKEDQDWDEEAGPSIQCTCLCRRWSSQRSQRGRQVGAGGHGPYRWGQSDYRDGTKQGDPRP